MVNQAIVHPQSIVVVGASSNLQKPGGKIVKNLLDSGFAGQLYLVNPKQETICGITALPSVNALPTTVDMAILAIPAADCPVVVEQLCSNHKTKAFIVVSAGFSEEGDEGRALEQRLVEIVNRAGATLIGPNCIGIATAGHNSIFTTPLPSRTPQGADLVSASGAMAVFIMEAGQKMGLRFNQIWSVGNAAQTTVEDVLEYLDDTYDAATQSPVKLLYFESIKSPLKLLVHATSLRQKGCWLVAVKAGTSQAGMRAAMSHTGALAGNDAAVDALFRKAGIVRCYGRQQLATIAAVLLHWPKIDKRVAIATHAGGPAVLLTDILEKGGFTVPPFVGEASEKLRASLFHGASTGNPIDVLATGNAPQLEVVLDACEHQFPEVGTVVVVFGSPGLFSVDDVYQVIHQQIVNGHKPILPVFPSVVNAGDEIERFIALGHPVFTDEVVLGEALVAIANTPSPYHYSNNGVSHENVRWLNDILASCPDGLLSNEKANAILDALGIPRVSEITLHTPGSINDAVDLLGFPLVAKVVGPMHKTDVGGVVYPILTKEALESAFSDLMRIKGASGVLVQPLTKGHELFIGLKREPHYGHLVMFGLGGIWVEALHDVVGGLAPLGHDEIVDLLSQLRSFPLFKGMRGQAGVNIEAFVEIIRKVSQLPVYCPQIEQLDLNPIFAEGQKLVAVDVRIIKSTIHIASPPLTMR